MEETFTYDNMDRLTGIDLTRSAGQGGDSLRYSYGFDRQRMRVEEFSTGWSRTKDYVGRCEFVTESGASGTYSRSLTFVTGPCGVFAVVGADVYGPMSFDDYLAKKKELGVPNSLKLKCEKQ